MGIGIFYGEECNFRVMRNVFDDRSHVEVQATAWFIVEAFQREFCLRLSDIYIYLTLNHDGSWQKGSHSTYDR